MRMNLEKTIAKIKLTKPKDFLSSNLELTLAIYTRASFILHRSIRDALAEITRLSSRSLRGLWEDEDGMVLSCFLMVEGDELLKREKKWR